MEANLPLNYYDYLDVSPQDFDLKRLKTNYRSLSLVYHPDKVSADGPTSRDPIRYYMNLKKGYEVLKNEKSRQMYGNYVFCS